MSQGCAEKVSGSWMETGYANTAAAASLSVLRVVPGLMSSVWPRKKNKKKSKSQRLTPWPGANSVHYPQRVNKLRLEDSTCTLRSAHSCKKCLWKMRQFNFILKHVSYWTNEVDLKWTLGNKEHIHHLLESVFSALMSFVFSSSLISVWGQRILLRQNWQQNMPPGVIKAHQFSSPLHPSCLHQLWVFLHPSYG